MQKRKIIEEKAIFIDVQETLVKNGNFLDKKLYSNMLKAQNRGAEIIIFTLAEPISTARYLKNLGVDTALFPVRNKFPYRGHLFSGLIVDDATPKEQGFLTKPNVYDATGRIFNHLVQQLELFPKLKFQTLLKRYQSPLPVKEFQR